MLRLKDANIGLFTGPRRRSRVGPDRYPGRADVQRGHLRVLPARGGGSDGQKARRGKEGASRADLSAGQSRIRRTTTPTEGNAIAWRSVQWWVFRWPAWRHC